MRFCAVAGRSGKALNDNDRNQKNAMQRHGLATTADWLPQNNKDR